VLLLALVLADGLAFSPALGAFGAALLMAGLVAGLTRGRRIGRWLIGDF